MDVTNPGLVNVADQVEGNPAPNGGTSQSVPEQLDVLSPVANQGFRPATNGVDAKLYATPTEIAVTEDPTVPPPNATYRPEAAEVNVDEQVIGQGVWVDVDPLNLAAGKRFVTPAEFTVLSATESIQTNTSVATQVTKTVTSVLDANTLQAASASSTRYRLYLGAPTLASYGVAITGREVVFADDTLTAADQGASRIVTGSGVNFIVIDRDDPLDPSVPSMTTPQVGDTLLLDVNRQGSEVVSQVSNVPVEVYIQVDPPVAENVPGQSFEQIDVNVTTGPQPGQPIITSGEQAPPSINVNVADQSSTVGLPTNVFV
jgi:hypothetical protein